MKYLLVLLFPGLMFAQGQRMYYQNQYPNWSPNGKQIIFNSDRQGSHDIYLMSKNGDNLSLVYSSEYDDIQPAWFPNGTHIVFASNKDGDWELFSFEIATQSLTQLTNNNVDDRMPVISPSAEEVAFLRGGYSDGTIYIKNLLTGHERQLIDFPSANPSWSVKNEIAFDGDGGHGYGIFKVKPDGSDLIQITNETDFRPIWSPSAEQLAFSSVRSGVWDCYISDSFGENVRDVTSSNSRDFWQTWSPDEKQMAFGSNRYGNYEILTVKIDSPDQIIRLTFQPKGDILSLVKNHGLNRAIRQYNKLRKTNQADEIIHVNNLLDLGEAFEREGKIKKALRIYKWATEIKPQNIVGYALGADLYLKQKNKKKALLLYESALEVNPESDYVLGKYKEAQTD